PTTRPRGDGVTGEDDDWAFGTGAGFYIDATREPWAKHYRMESYVARELFEIATTTLPGDAARAGIFGHSMGGHGALVLAQRHREQYRSVSAFAPIANPMQCPWGHKAFSGYLGDDRNVWAQYDASELMLGWKCPYPEGILIDHGLRRLPGRRPQLVGQVRSIVSNAGLEVARAGRRTV